ncbi:hypothetical protein HPB51_017203 [Rhipicephalus microplus]|uniref:CCHC-type domain-containing protein n=1 Tax=Rhipicephalus microplus TaxID=6941 RepID=A0A9J6EAW4_RHIMP|nr:hypothetical protein HPB51_001909 [Rhipicephalus microplus]KAH8031431.1 hypothetical protein HPB51_017203 [Rhipicephalus microplus]
MEYIVEGQDVSPEELSDESWQSPGLRAQEQRRAALRLATAATKPTTTPASLPSSKRVNTSPPQHRRRAPLPRLPADTIHIVGRPKSPVELTKLQPWHLYTALLQAAFLQDLPPASRDTVRIHPVNNTFTLSVADSARAQAYLRITSLTVSGNTFTVHLYAPPPDDALRGILYHAFDDFTDQAILEDLQASNPTLSVVGGRRMGKAPHILVTLMEPKLPRWIFYHGVQLRLLPFRNKVEACYNCRSTGHRTDVCPKPRQERCHRCGAAHPTPPEGSPPTCNPRCIVCNGNHSTYSSNCKHRYVQRPQRQKAPAPDTHPPPQQPVPPAAVVRSSQQAASGPSPAPPPKSVTASPPPVPAVPKPTSQPMNSTWPRGAPGLPSEPQVVALQQENASLRQQVTAQSAQIAAQKTQIDSLQAKLQALEEKLESAITVKSSLPSTICSSSDMDVQTPEGCTGKRRRPNTPLESLHFSEEVQVSIKTALVDLEERLDSRFNSVHQLLTAQHEALNSLRTDFAAYPPATSFQSLQSTSDALVPEPLVTYHDITQHYRLERYFYSHPHSSLPKRSEIAWRRLQTRTFPCPLVFSYMHPGAIDPRCCLCGNVASLNHILWGCPEDPPPADLLCSPPTEGQWEALLSSNDIDIQTRVLKRAEEVIEKHSLAAFVA